jgi:hypothetical protein
MAGDIEDRPPQYNASNQSSEYFVFGDQSAVGVEWLLPSSYLLRTQVLKDYLDNVQTVLDGYVSHQPSDCLGSEKNIRIPQPPIESPEIDEDDLVYPHESSRRMLRCFSVLASLDKDEDLYDFSFHTSIVTGDQPSSSLNDAPMMSLSPDPFNSYSAISYPWGYPTECCFCADGKGDFGRPSDFQRHTRIHRGYDESFPFPFHDKNVPLEAKVGIGIGIGPDTAQSWKCRDCGSCPSSLDDVDILEAPY